MSDFPHLWIPRVKILEPKRELALTARVGGVFRMRAIRPDGRVRPLAEFPNMVLNNGLDKIAANSNWMNRCVVGTGNAAPNPNVSSMDSFLAGAALVSGSDVTTPPTAPDYYAATARLYRFAAGTAAGNIAEVGITDQSDSNGTNLFARELVRDAEGNPTTITVLPDEILEVVYEHRYYPVLSDFEDEITISGDTYDIVARAANVSNQGTIAVPYSMSAQEAVAYNGSIGAVTGEPSGSSSVNTSREAAAYSAGNYYRDFTFTWSISGGNLAGGITAIHMGGNLSQLSAQNGRFQIGFTPAIPKDNTKVLSLTFRRAWARRTI